MSRLRNFGVGRTDTEPSKSQVLIQAVDLFNNLIKRRAALDMELEQKAFNVKQELKYSEYLQKVSIKKGF